MVGRGRACLGGKGARVGAASGGEEPGRGQGHCAAMAEWSEEMSLVGFLICLYIKTILGYWARPNLLRRLYYNEPPQ